jgi:hypothetical protein
MQNNINVAPSETLKCSLIKVAPLGRSWVAHLGRSVTTGPQSLIVFAVGDIMLGDLPANSGFAWAVLLRNMGRISLHWGEEFINLPSAEKVKLGCKLIDCGANVILGHHPHIMQGVERYRGKIIAYR